MLVAGGAGAQGGGVQGKGAQGGGAQGWDVVVPWQWARVLWVALVKGGGRAIGCAPRPPDTENRARGEQLERLQALSPEEWLIPKPESVRGCLVCAIFFCALTVLFVP